jgi:hypothetical protein
MFSKFYMGHVHRKLSGVPILVMLIRNKAWCSQIINKLFHAPHKPFRRCWNSMRKPPLGIRREF